MRFGRAATSLLATVFDEVFGKLIINRGFACHKKRTLALSAREKCHDPLDAFFGGAHRASFAAVTRASTKHLTRWPGSSKLGLTKHLTRWLDSLELESTTHLTRWLGSSEPGSTKHLTRWLGSSVHSVIWPLAPDMERHRSTKHPSGRLGSSEYPVNWRLDVIHQDYI
jgi:hypothetical protein